MLNKLTDKFKGDKDNEAIATSHELPPVGTSSSTDAADGPVIEPQDKGPEQSQRPVTIDAEEAGEENHVFHGVEEMEAITMTWTKPTLIAAYLMIFVIFFANSMSSETAYSLVAYVTSSFQGHSLIATTTILSSIIGGVSKLPIAKIIDVWGRVEGFALMVAIATIGMIMMAACQNVETYAAAEVFWTVGINGMGYVLDVFLADTSSLRNRALMFAFSSTPFIATSFAGPKAAQDFLDTTGWRWGYGCYAIVTPVVTLPMCLIFLKQRKIARTKGMTKPAAKDKRTFAEKVKYYFFEYDVIGMILIVAGFALVLLPLTLAKSVASQWKSAEVICMIVFGGVSLILFCIWEKWLTPVSFIPFKVLSDRTVLSACILSGCIRVASSCWSTYFPSFLQVVQYQTVSEAGYIGSIYTIGACIWAVPVGLYTNRFKWLAVWAACMMILGAGLMIKYRQPHVNIRLIIMCQIVMTLGGGTLVVCEQMAVMAASEHTNVAVCLALIALFTNIGASVGSAVAGAIWTNTFPQLLEQALPDDQKSMAKKIYSNILVQKKYPRGSETREAINWAYGVAEKRMCIAACAILILTIPCVLMWKDFNVKEIRRNKGRVA